MGMAMELACGRSCTMSALVASSSRVKSPLSTSRPQRVTTRRVSHRVRAGDEVGTEEAEKLSVKAETEEKSSSGSPANGSLPYLSGRKYTGYVEKDTAGQTNIYAVEPTVYVSESVFSSGEAGSTSAEEASNSVGLLVGLGLSAVTLAGSILFVVGNKAPVAPTEAVGYNGPPLSYYISKFSSGVPIEAAITVEDSVSPLTLSEETVTEGTL